MQDHITKYLQYFLVSGWVQIKSRSRVHLSFKLNGQYEGFYIKIIYQKLSIEGECTLDQKKTYSQSLIKNLKLLSTVFECIIFWYRIMTNESHGPLLIIFLFWFWFDLCGLDFVISQRAVRENSKPLMGIVAFCMWKNSMRKQYRYI